MERLTSFTALISALLFTFAGLATHGCDKPAPSAAEAGAASDAAPLASGASPVDDSGDATATAAEE